MENRRSFSLALSFALCLVALAALLLHVDRSAHAQSYIRYVAPTGYDTGTCNFRSNPCQTIQYAVDRSFNGDVIKVAGGVYTHSIAGSPQVVYVDKSLTVKGGYAFPGFLEPPDPTANPTTLDAQGQGRALCHRRNQYNV